MFVGQYIWELAMTPDPDLDQQLCLAIRRGEASALAEAVQRHYAIGDLLARVAAVDADPRDCLARAWRSLIAEVVRQEITGALRPALLERVVAEVHGQNRLDPGRGDTRTPGPFQPDGDRWEGWWVSDQVPWPADVRFNPELLLWALRQMPVELRILLVLRDVAGLSSVEAAPIAGVLAPLQTAMLDAAREAYVLALDERVAVL